MNRIWSALAAVSLVVFGLLVGAAPARAEAVLRAVGAFTKSNEQTISFLKFIDLVNAKGKGVLRIEYIGGPEVTPASKQPIALRDGLFDLLFGPPAYYLGMFPEGDAMDGMKTPAESRAVHGFEMIDRALRKRLGATFLGRFNFGIGLHVFLTNKPMRRPNGDLNLTGLKIRSSGSYLDFITALGATPVTMSPSEIYTALQRGVVNGAAASIEDAYTETLYKFLKYRIDPPFSKGVVILIGNANAIDGLPPKAQTLLRQSALGWEQTSMLQEVKDQKHFAQLLAKEGQQTITLTDGAARRYIDAYEDGVWARVKKNAPDLDLSKAEAAFR